MSQNFPITVIEGTNKNDNVYEDKANVAWGGWSVSRMFLIALSLPNYSRTEVFNGQEKQKIINDLTLYPSPQ